MEQGTQPNILIRAQVMTYGKMKSLDREIWQKAGFKNFLLYVNPEYINHQAVLVARAIDDLLETRSNLYTKFSYIEHMILDKSHHLDSDEFEICFQARFKAYREKKSQL